MSRIIIVDPDFEHACGHNLTANQIIASNVAGEVMILAPATLPAPVQLPGVAIRRVLPRNSYIATNVRGTLVDRLSRVACAVFTGRGRGLVDPVLPYYHDVLHDFFEEVSISRNDSIVVHTGSEVLLASVLDVIECLPEAQRPILHYRQVRPISDFEHAQQLHTRLAYLVRQNQAYIYSETRRFKVTLAALGHDIASIETLELTDCSRPFKEQHKPTDFVTVAVLGTVRTEKGHARLANIAGHYAQLAGQLRKPQLRYLIHAAHIKNRKLFDRMLKSLDAVNVEYEIVDAGPEEDVHWRCVKDCHVIMMPYDRNLYQERGSGVAIDAIVSARPLLISGYCTLEEYVRGENGLSAVSDGEFAQALSTVVQDYDSFSNNAVELALRVRTIHASHPFYARLGRPG